LKSLKNFIKKEKADGFFSNTDKPVLSIKKSLKTAARKAGITRPVSPNMLRHTFATTALMAGVNVMEVKEIMGHSHYRNILKERIFTMDEKCFSNFKEAKRIVG